MLPFYGQGDLGTIDLLTSDHEQSPTDEILQVLQETSTQLKIMHLNTQSMVSTFNEFALTVKSYPLDMITLSETWLKNQKELLEYVSLPGYATEFRHREVARGGGVGAYIRDTIKYKRRKDIEAIQPELEHLWLEVPGRNKHYSELCTAPTNC